MPRRTAEKHGKKKKKKRSATATVDKIVKLNGTHLAQILLHQMMLLTTGGTIKAFRQQSPYVSENTHLLFVLNKPPLCQKHKCSGTKKKLKGVLHKTLAI